MEEIMAQEDDDGEGGFAVPDAVTSIQQQQNRKSMGGVAPFIITTENEFAYFDPKTLQNWAGPNHWKFRPVAQKGENCFLFLLCSHNFVNNVVDEDGTVIPVEKEKKKGKKKE